MWFQTDQTGLFVGQCAEYCGTQHANMLLRVVVDSPAEFERWLENEREAGRRTTRPSARARTAFLAQSCVNCHRVRGTPAAGHLRSRSDAPDEPRDAGLGDGAEHAARTCGAGSPIRRQIKPGCLMPAFGLSDRDRDRIVDYLLTLR